MEGRCFLSLLLSAAYWIQTENANYAANDNTMYKITGTVVPGTVLPKKYILEL